MGRHLHTFQFCSLTSALYLGLKSCVFVWHENSIFIMYTEIAKTLGYIIKIEIKIKETIPIY